MGNATVDLRLGEGVVVGRVVGEEDFLQTRDHTTKDLQPLWAQLEIEAGHAGHAAPRPREALD